MRTVLSCIGFGVVFLAILGLFNIGHFVIIYDSKKIICVKE